MITSAELEAVRAGRIDLAFRRWDRARLRVGTRIVTGLDGLDRASRHVPWTRATLVLIGRRPGVRAPELALEMLREPMAFKRDVRRLKELGLPESLEVGY